LEFSQFDKTTVVFERECSDSGKPVVGLGSKAKNNHNLTGIQVKKYIESQSIYETFKCVVV
jgi:hypothetical protein